MTKLHPLLTGTLIAIVLAAGTFVAGSRIGGPSSEWDMVAETAEELRREAARPVSREELARAAVEGMLDVLDDPYAASLRPEEAREIDRIVDGTVVGIGVWLQSTPRGLRVTDVVEGSPAERAGIASGDVIVRAEGRSMGGVTVDEAAGLFRGPVGSPVEIVVARDDRRRRLEVERVRLDVPDVEAEMLDGKVAYARVRGFGNGSAGELREAVEGLLDEGADAVLLDLRGNAGGLAEEAVDVADLFLEDGVVARFRERGRPEREVTADPRSLGRFRLVVLVDGGTASAAELVAGALQDRDRATLVGLRTFGKGSVLTVSELADDTTIQYTTALLYTPDGHAIEGDGIRPDVTVLPGGEEDAQLERALRLLRG